MIATPLERLRLSKAMATVSFCLPALLVIGWFIFLLIREKYQLVGALRKKQDLTFYFTVGAVFWVVLYMAKSATENIWPAILRW